MIINWVKHGNSNPQSKINWLMFQMSARTTMKNLIRQCCPVQVSPSGTVKYLSLRFLHTESPTYQLGSRSALCLPSSLCIITTRAVEGSDEYRALSTGYPPHFLNKSPSMPKSGLPSSSCASCGVIVDGLPAEHAKYMNWGQRRGTGDSS